MSIPPTPPALGVDVGLGRASARVSIISGVGRIVGFARYIVLGVVVGTTYLGNTYETANWIPNIVFELAAGGVLSAVFVPSFVAALERGRERGLMVASALANTFLIMSVPVVLIGILAAEPIMRVMTIAVDDPVVRAQQIATGTWFLYVFLPQVPLYVLAMVMTGILHAHGRFTAPAAAPLFSSLVVISAYVLFGALGAGAGADLDTVTPIQRYVLAGGTTAGVFVLAFSQLPSVLRTGVRWRPTLGWSDPDVRRAIRAGLAGVAYFAVSEVGLIATLLFANRVEGGVIAYRVAFAFFDLPRALIGLPVAAVLLPALARRIARRDEPGFAALWSQGWRSVVFLGAPAAVGLFVLAPTVAEAVLSRAPTAAAPELVAATLRALAIGIPAFVLVEPLIRAFFARHQTKPPVLMNAVSVGVCLAILVPVTLIGDPRGTRALEVIGLAIAVGHLTGVGVGIVLLARRLREWRAGPDLSSAAASLVRAAVTGLAVFGMLRWLEAGAVAETIAGVAAGLGVYCALSLYGGELQRTWAWLRSA